MKSGQLWNILKVFFYNTINVITLELMYSKADTISQGSVATRLGCDGTFNDHLNATLLWSTII